MAWRAHVGFPCEEMREGQGRRGLSTVRSVPPENPAGEGAPLGWRSVRSSGPSLLPQRACAVPGPSGCEAGSSPLLFDQALILRPKWGSELLAHFSQARSKARRPPFVLERPWSNQRLRWEVGWPQRLDTVCGPWAAGRCTWIGAASACRGAGMPWGGSVAGRCRGGGNAVGRGAAGCCGAGNAVGRECGRGCRGTLKRDPRHGAAGGLV